MRELSGGGNRPRLFADPLFLRRTRKNITELVGVVWLVLEIARLVRSRLERLSAPHGAR